MKKNIIISLSVVSLILGACDFIQSKSSEQNQDNKQTTTPSQDTYTPKPYVAPVVASRHKVRARIYHWIFDGTPGGTAKLSHEYAYLDLVIYDDATMSCDGMSVRYSLFNDYDYECNRGNTGYVFNASDVIN